MTVGKSVLFCVMLLLFASRVFATNEHNSGECKALVPSQKTTQFISSTDSFLSYLSELFEQKIITLEDLYRVQKALVEKGQVTNPLDSKSSTSASSSVMVHREGLQDFIQSGSLDARSVSLWIEAFLKTASTETKDKESVQEETLVAARPLSFEVLPFRLYSNTAKIHYSLEMSDTHITKAQWADIMGGSKVTEPNLPMVNISFFSALEFANRLSLRKKLRPVYDLTQLDLEGSALEGTLALRSGRVAHKDQSFLNFIEHFKKENIKTEGFRIASPLEIEFLQSNLRRIWGLYQTSAALEKLIKDSAWVAENSTNRIQPVASLSPTNIGSTELYDLFGNVNSYVTDMFFNGGSAYARVHGGSFEDSLLFVIHKLRTKDSMNSVSADLGSPKTGFRLVRSLPALENSKAKIQESK